MNKKFNAIWHLHHGFNGSPILIRTLKKKFVFLFGCFVCLKIKFYIQ